MKLGVNMNTMRAQPAVVFHILRKNNSVCQTRQSGCSDTFIYSHTCVQRNLKFDVTSGVVPLQQLMVLFVSTIRSLASSTRTLMLWCEEIKIHVSPVCVCVFVCVCVCTCVRRTT